MNKLRAIIVDDEPLARHGIRAMLANEADIQIVAECGSGKEAVSAIRQHSPDLVFLDIQMPEMDGFGVLQKIGESALPYVIFVTAYDQYALRAFEVHALDYLLKPVDEERFEKALAHAKSVMRGDPGGTNSRILALLEDLARAGSKKYLDRVLIKDAGRVYFLRTADVDWIEAEGNYVSLHSGRQSHLLRQALTSLADQLDPEKFVRIHRSTIVSIDRIQELQPLFHGDYRVVLRDGTKLLLSRRYRDRIRERLGL